MRLLSGGYNYDLIAIWLQLDCHLTPIRLQFSHATTAQRPTLRPKHKSVWLRLAGYVTVTLMTLTSSPTPFEWPSNERRIEGQSNDSWVKVEWHLQPQHYIPEEDRGLADWSWLKLVGRWSTTTGGTGGRRFQWTTTWTEPMHSSSWVYRRLSTRAVANCSKQIDARSNISLHHNCKRTVYKLQLRSTLSLCFNGHFPGEPGLSGVYWSKGRWRWWVVATGLLEL